MTTEAERVAPPRLLAGLQRRLPMASLQLIAPPLTPSIRLWLLADILAGERLDSELVHALTEAPPYWCFSWASGQVLARYLLENPCLVRDRVVMDLGAGSGIVAIAAARAGAAAVAACDLDPEARAVIEANAEANNVPLQVYASLEECLPSAELVVAADILYDRENMALLARLKRSCDVLLADSRIRDLDPPGYALVARGEAVTWPDLDESREFRDVRVFHALLPGD